MVTAIGGLFNIAQNNSAKFIVEFIDSAGLPAVPTSVTMTVTYTNLSNVTQVDTVPMGSVLPFGSLFTGTWSSTSAALGLATWLATASPSSIQSATGQLRIIGGLAL